MWAIQDSTDASKGGLDFPQFNGHFEASFFGTLKCLGTDATQLSVSAGEIKERLDVVEHINLGQFAGLIGTPLDAFFF